MTGAVAAIGLAYGVYSGERQHRESMDAIDRQEAEGRLAREQRQETADMYHELYLSSLEDYHKADAVIGPLRADLNTYYTNLTGERLGNKRAGDIQKASQKAIERVSREFAQRGMYNSGLMKSTVAHEMFNTETKKAVARYQAEDDAINLKTKYLNSQEAILSGKRGRSDRLLGIYSSAESGVGVDNGSRYDVARIKADGVRDENRLNSIGVGLQGYTTYQDRKRRDADARRQRALTGTQDELDEYYDMF